MATKCCTKTDFTPAPWDWKGMKVGFSYPDVLVFTTNKGAAVDITADSFELIIKNSSGATIDTLTIGDGLEITGTNKLSALIGTPTTDAAGTYTIQLIWAQASTLAEFPIAEGTVIVSA